MNPLSSHSDDTTARHPGDWLIEENQVAAHVLSRMLSSMLPSNEALRYHIISSGIFSGDIVLAGITPSGKLHVLLADATGHGLPAAFTLMPIIPVFTAMTAKGFPLQDILFEMNRMLRSIMPIGRFVATTAVSVDFRDRTVKAWVGGNPGIIILEARSGSIRRIPPAHLALGIAEPEDRSAFDCEIVQLDEDDLLIFFSDGLTDTWATEDIETFIRACAPAEIFDRLIDTARQNKGHDDTSLVVLRVKQEAGCEKPRTESAAPKSASGPSLALSLDIRQMRDPDIASRLLGAAQSLGVVPPGDSVFDLVFNELFSNALDHGILGLSSEMKYADAAFDAYAELRKTRLDSLKSGKISVRIEPTQFSGKPATRLHIVDSGPGFDQSLICAGGEFMDAAPAGRGIRLAMNLCLRLSFSGNGNDVTAYVPRAETGETETWAQSGPDPACAI